MNRFFPQKVDGFHDSQPNPSTVEFRGLFRPAFSLKKSMDFTKLTQIHRLFIFLARRVLLRSYSAPQTGLEAFCCAVTWRPKQGSTCFRFAKPHRVAAATPVAKNSPQDCFLNAPAQGFESLRPRQKKKDIRMDVLFLSWWTIRDSNL